MDRNKEVLLAPAEAAPRRLLGLRQAVALIVGVVIGAGIFKSPSIVAGLSGSPEWMFSMWILGGVVSLIGALCYSELTTAYPHPGGDYHFLHRAYGRSTAFLFGWARFAVITTGSIALLAFVFGDYMQQAMPLAMLPAGWGATAYACAVIVVLSLLNLQGLRTGAVAQMWLTLAEISGLVLLVAAALFFADAAPAAAAAPELATAGAASQGAAAPALAAPVSFGMAMVFVLLTYGGWNEAAYISAEIRGGASGMVRALTFSILIITTLYLLVTWACLQVLGMQGMARSEALAADVMGVAFGATGEKLISVLVAVAALTSINATMIVGARTGFAMGRDWRCLGRLGQWNDEKSSPAVAMSVQCAAALLLVGVGTAFGGGFKAMVEFTAPVFWLFFLLSGVSLFVLRRREPDLPRPFRVPFYPLLPLLFCASCAWMLWSSLSYVYSQSLGGLNAAWIGVAVLASGVLLLFFLDRKDGVEPPSHP